MSHLVQAHIGVIENLRPLLEAYVKGMVRAARPRPPERMPTRAPDIERSVGPLRIHPGRVEAYLELTDGVDLGRAAPRLVPPVFYTTWSVSPFIGVLSSGKLGINLLGMVHLENDLEVHRSLRLDDRVTCRVLLEDLERVGSKLRLTVLCENRVGDTLASESRTHILIRLPGKGGGEARSAEEPPPDPTTWQEVRRLVFPANLGRRYGVLVGDVNPIHLWPATSRLFGFKRPIAHGFCLKAMVAHAVVRAHGGGDPARLERLRIRFRKPIALPGEALCLTKGDRFAVTTPDRTRLFADGQFTIGD